MQAGRVELIETGVIDLKPTMAFFDRLVVLGEALERLIHLHKPNQVAIEKIFLGKSAESAFKLGHARGVCGYVARSKGAEVYEYAAKTIKKCLTGSGSADKELVQTMVQRHLAIPGRMLVDASDALAVALTHLRQSEVEAMMSRVSASEVRL